jgi:signal peptidase I
MLKNKVLILTTIAFITLMVIMFLGLARPHRVSGNCMEPAVKDGQICFLNYIAPYLRKYKIGDIILFRHEEKTWISRIVALENDTIQITEENVAVNGVALQNPKINRSWANWKYGTYAIDEPFKVPSGSVFVLSDNLAAQHDDSRVFGPVAREAILGLIW